MRMRTTTLSLLLLVVTTGCGPFFLIPGGELEGTSAPTPSDWAFLAETSTVQIETQPEDPYSVNIWAVASDGAVYIHGGASRATWAEHLEANPAVRMRVESDIYSLRATRVVAQDEFDRFSDAYEAKYDIRPRNENVGDVYLFRLEGAPR